MVVLPEQYQLNRELSQPPNPSMQTNTLRTLSATAAFLFSFVASAQVFIDFEQPVYNVGPLQPTTVGGGDGQAGWLRPGYTGSGPVMDVVSGGLAGAQAATSIGDYTHDAYFHMEAYTNQPGVDFYTSFLWSTDGGMSMFSISANNAANGAQPVGLMIDGTDIYYLQLPTTPEWVVFENGTNAYVVGHVQEVKIGVDMGAKTYTVTWRDVTATGPWSTPQTVPMWAPAIGSAPAPGVVNDVLIGSRTGTATYDNIRMEVAPRVPAQPPEYVIDLYAGLSIKGTFNAWYRVEYVTDLNSTNWIPLTTFELTNSPYLFIDTTKPATEKRFYRTVVP